MNSEDIAEIPEPEVINPYKRVQTSPAEVSPGGEPDKKKQKSFQFVSSFRSNGSIQPKNFMISGVEINTIRPVGDFINLVYFEQADDEGYVHPLVTFISSPKADSPGRTEFLKVTGVVAVVPRRLSKEKNIPVMKTTDGRTQYKKCYLVCLKPSGYDELSTRKCLDTIASVSACHIIVLCSL
jgi:hypothetical protein